MRDSKVKIPMLITGINILANIISIVILLPLLMCGVLFFSKFGADILGMICLFLFIFVFFRNLIMIFITPIVQLVLSIAAIINKKWWLLGIHILLSLLFSGGNYVFFDWFTHLSV